MGSHYSDFEENGVCYPSGDMIDKEERETHEYHREWEEWTKQKELAERTNELTINPYEIYKAPEKGVRTVGIGDVPLGRWNPEPIKYGKDSAGKEEGARYCYLDALPFLHGHDSIVDPVREFCQVFNKMVFTEQVDTKEYTKLQNLLYTVHGGTRYELYKEIIWVRQQALKNGKYSPQSYQNPIDLNALYDAIARHLIKHVQGEDKDKESGVSHLGHIGANLLMCVVQLQRSL